MQYTAAFRRRMVARMTGPRALTAAALAREVGISQPTLSRWLRDAGTFQAMSDPTPERAKKPSSEHAIEDRVRILGQAAEASPEELGAMLRRHGLITADLDAWKAALGGVGKRPRTPRKTDAEVAEARRVRGLERDLARKNKALAEAAAILVLQKKVQALLGDEDGDTPPRSDR